MSFPKQYTIIQNYTQNFERIRIYNCKLQNFISHASK